MPFKVISVNDQRREFVLLAQQEGTNISALCRRYGISRQHGYALLRRAARDGIDAVMCQSRRPRTSPQQTSADMEEQIVQMRVEHPDWGARKIQGRLLALGGDPPAQSTITQILHRHALIRTSPGGVQGASQRFVRSEPNDLWQMDYMGHKPLHHGRVHPLSIIDDHSRFGINLTACADETLPTVWEHLERCFRQYGLPRSILTDNAAPWGHSGFALTTFDVRLIQRGVHLIHGRPYHPQTQGKVERWHRSINTAVFGPIPLRDLTHAQHAFDRFRDSYNMDRPHEALGMDVPINHYYPSPRPYLEQVVPPEYDDGLETRKVRLSGEIKMHGRRWRVSQSLAGEIVGLQPTTVDGVLDIYYYTYHLRTIDLRTADSADQV